MATTRPPSRLQVLIVDDEAPARALLCEYLAGEPDLEVTGECANGFAAIEAINSSKPDLLLLDIQMPGMSGFELLDLLEEDIQVVFITAHDEHAVRAFEIHAVDYLLKPFSRERLRQALGRARARLGRGERDHLAQLAETARPAGRYLERVLVRCGARVEVIPIARLEVAEAEDDYVCLHAGGRTLRKQQTLSELEAQLDPARFVRIHRSFIVNLTHLAGIERYAKDSRLAVLTSGAKLPLSRAGYARLRQHLERA